MGVPESCYQESWPKPELAVTKKKHCFLSGLCHNQSVHLEENSIDRIWGGHDDSWTEPLFECKKGGVQVRNTVKGHAIDEQLHDSSSKNH